MRGKRGGLTIIAVVGIMVVLAFFGMAIAKLVATGHALRSDHALYETANMVTEAGIEYGIKKIYEANSAVVNEPGVSFGEGNFIISQSGRTLTVTGRVGEVSVARQVDSPTEADCTTINVSNVNVTGNNDKLSGIKFQKICLVQITLAKVNFSWVTDGGEKLKKIKVESSVIYNDSSGVTSGTLIDVTDYVVNNGSPNNMNSVDFNKDISGKTFNVIFTFGDGSVRQVTFTPT